MTSNTQYLFEQIHSGMFNLIQELDKPKLRNNFVVNKVEIQLTLTDNYIILSENAALRAPTHFCRLGFDVKFELIYTSKFNDETIGSPIAFKLERQNCTQQLIFQGLHPQITDSWALELQKKINQRNFHKLFKAKKKIGKGAFATVYLAERLRDHKMVAVKAFSKEKQYSSDKGRESLQNQIKLMRKLNHSNVMRLEGVYQTDNSIYVILEYLQGTQLNDMLKSGKKLQGDEILLIIQNILRGLSHLNKSRIIHRDLKPQNIMFRKQNSCDLAICDFGLATHADQDKYLFVRCGTPGFVAPEIINIRDMTTKSQPISDVFSAGVIFHHLLFGTSIFQGKKYNQILNQNRSCEFNFSKQIYSKLHPTTFDLLTKMLEKDPFQRISAELALNHTYFTGQMEIQKQQKNIFRQLTNTYSSQMKDVELTPSSMSRKKDERISFFQSSRMETARPFMFS